MESMLNAWSGRMREAAVVLAAGVMLPASLLASDTMSVAQQNALVKKQCVLCHNDAQRRGLLTLEHFDAARPDPSLTAMLVSKLTSGLAPTQVRAARHDSAIEALVAGRLKTGAMGAGGIGVPDRATQDALLSALAAASVGATEWTVNQTDDSAAQELMLTASILRDVPSTGRADNTDMYRLTLTCRGTRDAEMLLTWANDTPPEGRPFSVAIDDKVPFTVKAEGGAQQGNGKYGPGGVILYPLRSNDAVTALPAHTLTVREVFPGETVVFPLDRLTQPVRQTLAACFEGNKDSQ